MIIIAVTYDMEWYPCDTSGACCIVARRAPITRSLQPLQPDPRLLDARFPRLYPSPLELYGDLPR